MAVWQVTISLIKENSSLNCSEKHFEDSLDKIKEVLPAEKSWCKSIKQLGILIPLV